MSCLNISCGSFSSEDKAGTPFQRVIDELREVPEGTRKNILSGFDTNEYTVIDPEDANVLIPSLLAYREKLIADIGHGDCLREIEREEKTGVCSIKLKWGEGRGWRLYCTVSLLAACQESGRTRQPVLVSLG
jgi:hypothetical protein